MYCRMDECGSWSAAAGKTKTSSMEATKTDTAPENSVKINHYKKSRVQYMTTINKIQQGQEIHQKVKTTPRLFAFSLALFGQVIFHGLQMMAVVASSPFD